MQDILEAVSTHYAVPLDSLKSQGRAKEVVLPRQVAMYLIRDLTSHSLPEIGTFFARDHSTVLYAIQKVSELADRDADLTNHIKEIRNRLS
jgi:chromosomal replication initiator protein